MHARGYGAHGYFENYGSLSDITRADLFQRAGEKTPVFVRFSTVAGSKGSADLARDVRGFAVKLYTKEGNWDLVGNNIPVFFIQDAIKFPDMVHAAKEEPDRGFPQAQTAHDNFWDFISLTPGKHAHAHVDHVGPRDPALVPLHGRVRRPHLPAGQCRGQIDLRQVPLEAEARACSRCVWNEAVKINGADPDFHRRDLWDAIQTGDFPEWELGLQLFDEEFADKFDFDVLDATKIIPEEDWCRCGRVGRLVLDRVRRQFLRRDRAGRVLHAEHRARHRLHERPAAAGPQLLLSRHAAEAARRPQFHPSADQRAEMPVPPLPAGRAYGDAQPEGARELRAQLLGRRAGGPRESPDSGFHVLSRPKRRGRSCASAPRPLPTITARRASSIISQTPVEQEHIATAFIFELSKVETLAIRARMVSHLLNVDEDLAKKVADGLRLKEMPKAAEPARPVVTDLQPSPALSILANPPGTFKGRKLGVLVSDGVDADLLHAVQAAFKQEGAVVKLVAPMVGGVEASDGSWIAADEKIDGGPSVVFDAVAILISDAGAQLLAQEATARDFAADAFAHCKFIGHSTAAMPLLEKAGIAASRDSGVIALGGPADVTRFLETCRQLRLWQREATVKRV